MGHGYPVQCATVVALVTVQYSCSVDLFNLFENLFSFWPEKRRFQPKAHVKSPVPGLRQSTPQLAAVAATGCPLSKTPQRQRRRSGGGRKKRRGPAQRTTRQSTRPTMTRVSNFLRLSQRKLNTAQKRQVRKSANKFRIYFAGACISVYATYLLSLIHI